MVFNDFLIKEATSVLQRSKCGFITSLHLTEVVDKILVEDFDELAKDSKITLLAVGGYGRKELAPFSDIDIMIIANKRDPLTSESAERLLYSFWDKGINISHSFRTINETLEDSLKDLQTRTSLLDVRFISGNKSLFNTFILDAYQKIVKKNKKDFISQIFNEVYRRYKTFSLSLYQLEPNIKEGRGGLRDLHTILWLCRIALGFKSLDDLKSLFTKNEFRHFKRACEFILRTRIYLHVVSRRKNELLTFEYQEALSNLMGFKKTNLFLGSEIFMRVYYRHSRTIMDALKKVMNLFSKTIFSLFPPLIVKKASKHFCISKGEIILDSKYTLDSPELILEAFYVYATTNKEFSERLQDLIGKKKLIINKDRQLSSHSAQLFIKILSTKRVYETLYEMHRLGILDRLFSDFGRLRYLVVYEPYHRYTVDEHTLRTIKHLESLRNNSNQKFPLLNNLTLEIAPYILYIALLFHDIGKGIYGSSMKHEGEGYKRLKTLLEPFEIDKKEKKTIEFLVKNHIFLSKYALKRDIDDIETIKWIADTVENEYNLKALLLITFADMSAVNPEYFTDWKAKLLFEIYHKTISHLRGDVFRIQKGNREFLSLLPERYAVASSHDDIIRDHKLFESFNGNEPMVEIRKIRDENTEIIIVAHDERCLFLKILDVIGSEGLNILNARLYPTKNERILDKITVSNWANLEHPGFTEYFIRKMKQVITSETRILNGINVENYREKIKCEIANLPSHLVNFETFVEIDNESSGNFSIIEFFAGDRIGLLFDVARIFSLFDVDISSAVINTEDNIAHDVFYVQHKAEKLDSLLTLKIIRAVHYVLC